MKTIKTKGIVIRSLDYKDTSKIVYVLSSQGMLSIRALGAKNYRNKNYNFSEPLTYVEFEITDTSFPSLVEYSVIDNFSDIKANIKKIMIYGYFLEFLTKLPSDMPFLKTFDYTLKTIKLGRLYEPLLLVLMYQVKVLGLFGIKPSFLTCSYCHKKPTFIALNGSVLCEEHYQNGSYLLKDILRLFYFDLKKDNFESINDVDLKLILDFVTNYYSYHADLKLKSLRNIALH